MVNLVGLEPTTRLYLTHIVHLGFDFALLLSVVSNSTF